jgi:hypothetical protein
MVGTAELERMPAQVEALSIDALAQQCRVEAARYRRGEPNDDRFALELFKRAVVDGENSAWIALQGIFHTQVIVWCRSAARCPSADPEDLACATWERFWRSFTPAKLAAAGHCAGVMSYLKLCARSAAADEARSYRGLVSLDDSPLERADAAPILDEAAVDRDARARFWSIVNASLHDERERVLAYLSYELDLKSTEIQSKRPDLFPSVTDVYQVARNVLDRLKRNRDLQAWFCQSGC